MYFFIECTKFFSLFFLPVGIGSDIYRFNVLRKDLNKKYRYLI